MEGGSDENDVQDEETRNKLALAATAPTVDTILSEGELLYIPSYWFHYIISLQTSIQCNSRSGHPNEKKYDSKMFGGKAAIDECLGASGAPLNRDEKHDIQHDIHDRARHQKKRRNDYYSTN